MFNVRGRSSNPSITGAFISSLIYMLLTLYASYSFIHLVTRNSPSISSYIENGVVTNEYELNLRDNNLHIAFTIEGFLDEQTKMDTRYVKAFTRIVYREDYVDKEKMIPFH